MASYVTQEYNFFDAITAKFNLESDMYKGFEITNVKSISDNMSIVSTTHGKFHCESFEDDDKNIYMKVTQYV